MTIRVILLWIIRQPCNIPCFLVHINVIIQVTLAIIWQKAVLYQTTETILLLRCQKQQMFFYGRDLQMTNCLEMLGNCGSLIYLFLLNSLHKVLLVMFPKWTNYNVETKIYILHLNLFFLNLKSVLQSECLNKNVIISLPLSFSLPSHSLLAIYEVWNL